MRSWRFIEPRRGVVGGLVDVAAAAAAAAATVAAAVVATWHYTSERDDRILLSEKARKRGRGEIHRVAGG